MKLKSPSVGPIVGFTDYFQSRIWLRGDFEPQNGSYRRCFGAIRYKKEADLVWSATKVGKLSPNFDMSGVFPLTGLSEDTGYLYQVGWFFADAELEDMQEFGKLDWSGASTGSFRTGTSDTAKQRSYIVGSCRYLLRLFGGTIFDDRGDKVFRSILDQIKKMCQVDGLLMIGDQVYADDLNFFAPDRRLDQFLERYRMVFSQPHIRELMSSIPTYMILDDHEIEDNWPSKATKKDMVSLYPQAIHAYQVYQCSHSPLFSLDAQNNITGTLSHFWYNFSDGCADWFVMDTRTERIWSDNSNKRRMVKQSQLEALLAWLADGSGLVKLVVTSVPLFPDLNSDSDDKWCGYLSERSQILDFILENKISKVAFVSGDVHCSFTAQLTSPNDPDFRVFSIISSSFFWPYPHMEKDDFVLNGLLQTMGKYKYSVTESSLVHSTDNFARLDVDTDGISVSFFERKGDSLGKSIRLDF